MKKIKRRDGTEVVVDDAYIIQNGESFSVPLTMMDSSRTVPTGTVRMVTDAFGHPAGARPGFLYADGDISLAVKETLHREYCDAISQRWQSDRWSKPSGNLPTAGKSNQPSGTLSKVDKVQSVADAYAQYNRDIQERWRK